MEFRPLLFRSNSTVALKYWWTNPAYMSIILLNWDLCIPISFISLIVLRLIVSFVVTLLDISLTPQKVFLKSRSIGKGRSEEHTSELQSRGHLVCRLLLEKKNATG